MPSLAEVLAAKKAASEQQTKQAPTVPKEAVLDILKQEDQESKLVTAIKEAKKQEEKVISLPKTQLVDCVSTVDLRPRIAELLSLSEENLENAMKDLKEALMHNPAAVTLMLPEDIGAMVEALRKITKTELVAATTKTPKAKKQKALTVEEMEKAFSEL